MRELVILSAIIISNVGMSIKYTFCLLRDEDIVCVGWLSLTLFRVEIIGNRNILQY